MKRPRILILFALLLAIVTTFLLYRYIETLRKGSEVSFDYGKVVVAATDIPEHVKITPEMLLVKDIPIEAIHSDAARSSADVIGFTTTMNILANEQVLKAKIALDPQKVGLSYQIPENMRAIVLPTGEVTGLAGYLEVGDKVDILVTYNGQTTPGQHPKVSNPGVTTPIETVPVEKGGYIETITQLQNIEVLAIGVKPHTDEKGNIVQAGGVPTSVTLLVTPQQAEVVAYIQTNATFQMTLRNPVDGVEVLLSHYGNDNFNDWRNR